MLREAVKDWDAWQIAGTSRRPSIPHSGLFNSHLFPVPVALERATYTTKSFLIAFALVSGRLTADQAARAAQVEVSSQIELWGEVEDCKLPSRWCMPAADESGIAAHDVDYQDIRRQLGSVVCLLSKTT